MEQPTERTCKTCSTTKPLGEFYRNPKGYHRRVCKDCVRAAERHRYTLTRERHRETNRAWASENREYYREAGRRWYKRNREARRAQIDAYRAARPEWDAERNREQARRRRARIAGVLTIPFTADQLSARIAYYGGRCWICRSANYEEMDHVKPIKAGGPHILANLRPACRSCNASKNSAWPFPLRQAVTADV